MRDLVQNLVTMTHVLKYKVYDKSALKPRKFLQDGRRETFISLQSNLKYERPSQPFIIIIQDLL